MITSFQEFIREGLFSSDNKMKTHEKLVCGALIDFMKSHLGFNAIITVRKKDAPNLLGDISLNNNSVNHKKFTVHFNANQSYAMMIKSMLHELTHVKQVANGELKPSADYKAIIWKGEQIITVKEYTRLMKDYYKYAEIPFEKEAYTNQDALYKPFLQSSHWTSLRGKDVTLDFIMDNL